MADAAMVAETWLGNTLGNDATLLGLGLLGVYSESVPENTLGPYIVWSQSSAIDNYEVGIIRVNTQFEYLVRVVMETRDWEDMRSLVERMDTLLNMSMGLALGVVVQWSYRAAPYQSIDDYGVTQWRQKGGRYSILVAAT